MSGKNFCFASAVLGHFFFACQLISGAMQMGVTTHTNSSSQINHRKSFAAQTKDLLFKNLCRKKNCHRCFCLSLNLCRQRNFFCSLIPLFELAALKKAAEKSFIIRKTVANQTQKCNFVKCEQKPQTCRFSQIRQRRINDFLWKNLSPKMA